MKNLIFRIGFALGYNNALIKKRARLNKPKVAVLLFHRVSDRLDLAWPPMPTDSFKRLMKYISIKYKVIHLTEINNVQKSNKPYLVLSFDDGYHDFLQNALPVLKQYHLPFNLNIVVECAQTGSLIWTQRLNNALNSCLKFRKRVELEVRGKPLVFEASKNTIEAKAVQLFYTLSSLSKSERLDILTQIEDQLNVKHLGTEMLTWNEIKESAISDANIGSHSYTHDNLALIEDPKILDYEIDNSRNLIGNKIGKDISAFSFPNGLYNETVVDKCVASGYKFLLTTKEDFYIPSKENYNHFIVPRISISSPSFFRNCFKIENL